MKQAILITSYKNFSHLIDLIAYFKSGFNIYIHIDAKSKPNHDVLDKINAFSQVNLLSRRYSINWGGVNLLKSILLLADHALKDAENCYFHMISGDDWPLIGQAQFEDRFVSNTTQDYLSYFKLPDDRWKGGGLNRIQYYHFYDKFNVKSQKIFVHGPLLIQRLFRLRRRLPSIFKNFFGGSNYWSLTRESLDYVTSFTRDHPDILNRMNYTFAADEIYFQTVLLNSKLAYKIVNDNLRYICWEYRNGSSPAFLDISDFEKIQQGNHIFARKFDQRISSALKEKITKELLNAAS